MADRAVFQGAETESQDQDLCGDKCQCSEDPDMDGTDRHADPEIPSAKVTVQLVFVELGVLIEDESVYPPGPVGMAGQPI